MEVQVLQRVDRFWRIAFVTLLSGIVIAGSVYAFRQRQEDLRIEEMVPQMESADPLERLTAAEQVLRVDRGRRDARYVKAVAILDLHRDERRKESRAILHSLIDDPKFHQQTQARLELANSYLNEAAETVAGTIPAGAEVARRQIEETLLPEARAIREQLNADEVGRGTIILFEAREIDVLAGIQRVLLRRKQLEAAQATTASQEETRRQLDIDISRLRVRIRDLDKELVSLCAAAAALEPEDASHEVLMFRMYLRQGQVDEARQVAARVARRESLDGATAGEIAGSLLDLERIQAINATPEDVALARELLNHPRLTNRDDLKVELASASLAIQEDRPAEAEAMAKHLLARYAGHPRAMLLLTLAMLRQGRGAEALDMLSPYNEEVRTADGRMAMGLALLQRNSYTQGRDYLQQSLQISPNNLPARLALIESYVATGEVSQVAGEVGIAFELAPGHPQVRRYRTLLMAENRDRVGLARMLRERAYTASPTIEPADCAMAILLLLGDPSVDDMIADRVRERPDDSVGLVATAARHMTPEMRIDATTVMVRELISLMNVSPLSTPVGIDADRIDVGQPSAVTGQPPVSRNPLEGSRFIPWAFEDAMRLSALVVDRWPSDPLARDLAMRCAFWLGDDATARRHLAALVAQGGELSTAARVIDAWYQKKLDDPELQSRIVEVVSGVPQAGATPQYVQLRHALAGNDPLAVSAILESMVATHPWAEPAMALVLADMLRKGDAIRAEHWLKMVERLAPRMGALSRARYMLATGKAGESIAFIEQAMRDEPANSHMREQGTDIIARANLRLEHIELAAGALDQLAVADPDRAIQLRLMVVDAHLSVGRRSPAVLAIGSLLTDAKMTSRGLDRSLGRAERVMPPEQLMPLITTQLNYRPEEPVLLVYMARQNLLGRNLEAAAVNVAALQRLVPNTARTRATELLLATAAGNEDEVARLTAILTPEAAQRVRADWAAVQAAMAQPATESEEAE
jgi:tetratricopeptide (TPR) repeat protein